jgi:hypothetical protein
MSAWSLTEQELCLNRAKVIASYFTQLHRTPENDRWWGPGFTDWVNVRKAQPLFPGHNQPRRPQRANYYDQSREDTIRWQVDLARTYGIHGFCHYHYWFDGVHLLGTPTEIFLRNKDIAMPFCLAWANETWSRRWDGQDHEILQAQTHEPSVALWQRHFDYLIRAWTDERALRIEGKPVFVIYRPFKIHELTSMLDFWQERARKHGLDGIHFLVLKQYEYPEESIRPFDGIIHFQPFHAMPVHWRGRRHDRHRRAVELIKARVPKRVLTLWSKNKGHFEQPKHVDYDEVWKQVLIDCAGAERNAYPGAFVDWDNTARYGRRATIFDGVSPERFEHWFRILVRLVQARPEKEPWIYLNAWNEWAEGTYLEPDERHGSGYLEALRKALETG